MDAEQPEVHNEVVEASGSVAQVGHVHRDMHVYQGRLPPRVPRQLPSPVAVLVNQERVRMDLIAKLSTRASNGLPVMAAVAGPEGLGKSTVAIYVLHQHVDDFPDGQLYADLGGGEGGLARVAAVLAEFLAALGVERSDIPPELSDRASMFRSLTQGRSIQVLVEDVGDPSHMRYLVPGPGGSAVVLTSRRRLGALKHDHDAAMIDISPLEEPAAKELLRRFAGDRLAAEPVAAEAVLARCDGLPIALCMVGAMLADDPQLTMAELAGDLTGKRPLTVFRDSDGRSLSAVFDAAYRRLGPEAQVCYRVLGLHPGSGHLSADALAAVIDLPDRDVRAGLRELRARRIVEQPAAGRYEVHNLVREHARLLSEATDSKASRESAKKRFLEWYLCHALAADDLVMPQRGWWHRLFPSLAVAAVHRDRASAWGWLNAERENLRAAVELAARLEDDLAVCRLVVALWSLYEPGKHFDDLLATTELALPAARRLARPAVETVLLTQLTFPYHQRGQADEAYQIAVSALEIARRCGDPALEASAIEGMGLARYAQGNVGDAIELLRKNLVLAEKIGDLRRIAIARFHLAKAVPPSEAVVLLTDAEADFAHPSVCDEPNLGKVWRLRGVRRTELGQRELARADLDRALERMTELERPYDKAEVLLALGDWAVRGERFPEAASDYQAAQAIAEEHGFLRLIDQARARLASLPGSD